MKTLSRILQRLAVVVGAIGLLVVIGAFIANYRALTAWSPPESDFAPRPSSTPDISDLPVPPTSTAPKTNFDPGSAVPVDDVPIPYDETVEGRRKVARDAIMFDAALFFIPTALLFALAWVVKPPAVQP